MLGLRDIRADACFAGPVGATIVAE
jgi:hypothetical protein